MSSYQEKKKTRKWPFVLGGLAVLVVLAIVFITMNRPVMAMDSSKSATAAKGKISLTVVGTGNLENTDAKDFKVYSALKYDEVFVETGDAVVPGDVFASIEADSILDRIKVVQGELDSLNEQIYAADQGSTERYMNAVVSGRVKRIFAEEGCAAKTSVMTHGALAVIAVDGKMAVDFESADTLEIGNMLTVLLPDGTTRDAEIKKANGSSYTATFDDRDVTADVVIKVKQEDKLLAEAPAYIYEPLKLTATEGIVRDIYVSEGDYVYSGSSYFYLTEIPNDSAYQALQEERLELQTELGVLLRLSETNQLVADFTGDIAAVNIKDDDSSNMVAAENDPQQVEGIEPTVPQETEQQSSGENKAKKIAVTYYPPESMKLNIQIDELDILSIHEGQQATIVFDAIPDREFSATISTIGKNGVVVNGAAKYDAELIMDKVDEMRAGMNATATIVTQENNNALLVPVAALQEEGDRIYVYTAVDEETKQLTGEREVTTGLSDGDQVEITSGLNEGEDVYYMVKTSKMEDIQNGFMVRSGGSGTEE